MQSIPKSHKSFYLSGNVFAPITDKEIDSFLTKTLALPEHSSMIAAIKQNSSQNDEIKNLYKDKDAFRACLTFLSMVTKTKTKSSKHTAYGLKHDVERFSQLISTRLYIPMAIFIFAAIYSGFLYKGQDNYRYITFNMSARSLNELDKLEYNLKALRAMPQDQFYLSLMNNI